MTKNEFIKRIKELDRILLEEIEAEELTDYSREHAHINLQDTIEILKENY